MLLQFEFLGSLQINYTKNKHLLFSLSLIPYYIPHPAHSNRTQDSGCDDDAWRGCFCCERRSVGLIEGRGRGEF